VPLTPNVAEAKLFLQCNGHTETADPAWCNSAKTCFRPDQFLVVIDGEKGEINGVPYNVKTANDAYSLFPVDPRTAPHGDEHLSIHRIDGSFSWWPRDMDMSKWHYDQGSPGSPAPGYEDDGCHAVKQRF
jgi:hypothetical protein